MKRGRKFGVGFAVLAVVGIAYVVVRSQSGYVCVYPRRLEAASGARITRTAVQMWQAERNSLECPNIDQLIAERILGDGARVDPWGAAWSIACAGEKVVVSSGGPDGIPMTPDDVTSEPTSEVAGS
jgi:hypothetical protein